MGAPFQCQADFLSQHLHALDQKFSFVRHDVPVSSCQEAFVALAQTISRFEPVTMCVPAILGSALMTYLEKAQMMIFNHCQTEIVEMAQNDGA